MSKNRRSYIPYWRKGVTKSVDASDVGGQRAGKSIDRLVSVQVKKHFDNKGGHPHVILGDIDDKHVSVGFTRDLLKGKNHPNYELEQSLFDDKTRSYMHRQGTVDSRKKYSQPRVGKMTPKDYKVAKQYGENAKQKYLDKKNKKK